MRFSYLDSTVELISIAPAKNIPPQRVVKRLLSDVQVRVPDCRRDWWLARGTICLANQWAMVSKGGNIELLPKPAMGAQQIAEPEYDSTKEQVHAIFRDGTKVQVDLGPHAALGQVV